MTPLAKSYYHHLSMGVSQVEAARRAGSTNPPEYVREQRRSYRPKIQRLLARLALKDTQVLQPFIDALTATKTLVATHEGKFLDEKEVPDWEHRLKAADWLADQLRLKQAPVKAAEPSVEVSVQVTAIDALAAVALRAASRTTGNGHAV